MKAKIYETIAKLDQTNYDASLDWYFILHDYAKNLADRNGLTLLQTAGIISALSPMVMFTTNLRDAERFCSTRSIANLATYTAQRMKALRIIGATTEKEVLEILGGSKTKSFFLNIYKPQKSLEVVLDVHMLRFFDIKVSTPKRYKQASSYISEVASEMGIKPHQVQALLWVAQRGKAF
jgi:hypothetical protein